MTTCHIRFIFQLLVYVFLLGTITATGRPGVYISARIKTNRLSRTTPMLDLENKEKLRTDLKVEASETDSENSRDSRKRDIEDLNYGDYAKFLNDAEEEDMHNDYQGFLSSANKRHGTGSGPKVWDHWGKWSHCSVTCGIGKLTRWRHCVSGSCATGEKEAQIKTCTLAAC